jgi:hypothetical protein
MRPRPRTTRNLSRPRAGEVRVLAGLVIFVAAPVEDGVTGSRVAAGAVGSIEDDELTMVYPSNSERRRADVTPNVVYRGLFKYSKPWNAGFSYIARKVALRRWGRIRRRTSSHESLATDSVFGSYSDGCVSFATRGTVALSIWRSALRFRLRSTAHMRATHHQERHQDGGCQPPTWRSSPSCHRSSRQSKRSYIA